MRQIGELMAATLIARGSQSTRFESARAVIAVSPPMRQSSVAIRIGHWPHWIVTVNDGLVEPTDQVWSPSDAWPVAVSSRVGSPRVVVARPNTKKESWYGAESADHS